MSAATAWGAWLVMAMALGCSIDALVQRLPNALCGALAVGGLLQAAAYGGPAFGWSLLAGGCGAAPLLLAWLRGAVGAGDVKYFFALCTYLQPAAAFWAFLWASVIGGLLVVGQTYLGLEAGHWHRRVGLQRIPYALALSGGFACAMWGGKS